MDVFNLSEEQYVLGIQGTLVSLFLKPYYRIGKQTDRREVTDPEVQMPNLRGTPASVTEEDPKEHRTSGFSQAVA